MIVLPIDTFEAKYLAGGTKEIYNVYTGVIHHIALAAQKKRYWLSGGRDVPDSLCHHNCTDTPYVCQFEKMGHERCLGSILPRLDYLELLMCTWTYVKIFVFENG